MAEYTGNFETGTAGNTVSAADAGSANAWNDKASGAGSTLTYSATQAYGTLSAQCILDAGGGESWVAWNSATIGTSLTEVWGRIYMYFTSLPTGGVAFWVRGFDTGSRAWESYIDTLGHINVRDQGGTNRGVGTVAISTGQWIRLEYHVQNSTTAGLVEVKLFNSADSATASETITSTGSFSTLSRTDLLRTGASVQTGHVSNTVYIDNVLLNDTGYPGPYVPSVQTLLASADSVDGNWHDNTGGTNLSGAIDESTASDSDYITSELHPTTSTSRVKLASGIDPASSTGHVIHWRVRKDATGGDTVDMTVTLRQGGGNALGGGTQIATFNRTNVDGTGWTTYDETLSGGEADSITNYSDLYLEFTAAT